MADSLVDRYLRDLRENLRDLPEARQRELVAEIADHIDSALAETPTQGEADVRNVLERLGDPAEIAYAAGERLGIRRVKAGWRETAAVILLPIGGVLIPVLGWIVGLLLLWSSPVWTSRDKWIGSLIVPGGLLLPVVLATFPSGGCGAASIDGKVVSVTCAGLSGLSQAAVAIVMALLIVAPIATAIHLARRASSLSRG